MGERGLRLSGGEKQRVAFARTILKVGMAAAAAPPVGFRRLWYGAERCPGAAIPLCRLTCKGSTLNAEQCARAAADVMPHPMWQEPSILLLDEATSSLDSLTERRIQVGALSA